MTDRELMQQALEALLEVNYDQAYAKEITALRERLAQPEQEPVAWRYKIMPPFWTYSEKYPSKEFAGDAWDRWQVTPLYTTPPHRKPLTDEELYKVFPAIATYTEANKTLYRSIARAIEAAHGIKEKNT